MFRGNKGSLKTARHLRLTITGKKFEHQSELSYEPLKVLFCGVHKSQC